MINRFRSFSVVNIVILVVVTFLMRVSAFLSPGDYVSHSILEPFVKLMIQNNSIDQLSYSGNVVSASFIVLAQGLLMNRVINNHILFGRPTLLPALCYVIVSSIFPQFLVLSAPLLTNFFIIWMFAKIVRMSKAGNPMSMMFDMGLIVAVGTFLYFPFILMILIVLLGLLLFRPFYWREWFAAILGFVTAYLFVAVFYYWNNNFYQFLNIFTPFANKFPNSLPLEPNDYLPLIPLAVLLFGGFWLLRQNFYNNFVAARKTYQWLFYTILIAIASFYLKPGNSIVHFMMVLPGISVFVAYYFNFARAKWLYETLFWVFILCIQCFHYV